MDFKNVKVDYVGEKEAIAIANTNLKQALFQEAKKKKKFYTLIRFHKFAIKLVKAEGELVWFIKVLKGDWGANEYEGLFGREQVQTDGDFDEKSNIRCTVRVEDGEFIYHTLKDVNDFQEATEKEYKEFIKYDSFFVNKGRYRKSPPAKKENGIGISWLKGN